MIDQKNIEDIRAKADIVDIIGKHVVLKKRGRNYLGLCPFHNEKSPSFIVSPEKNIWKCFGCGKSGNVFSFVMETEKMDFIQAVKALGEIVGVEVKDDFAHQHPKGETDILYDINEKAVNYFIEQLQASAVAQAYIQGRNLSAETVKEFKLGFAPELWDGLIKKLGHDYSLDKIAQAGLIIKKETGNDYYDRFRKRLMFPIHDLRGKVIGFSGRVIDAQDTNTAKYVNSPETIIFNKGNNLYGLHRAKQAIIDNNAVILVEGQMDVVACHSAGLINTVASLGTAFTINQAKLLARFTKNVIIGYDTDGAGQQATDKNIDILLPLGFSIKILDIPEKDPDEMIQKHGVEKLREAVANAHHFILFKLNRIIAKYDIKDRVQRSKAATEGLAILEIITDSILHSEYLNYLSKKLQLGREVLQELRKSSKISTFDRGGYVSKRYVPAPASKYIKAEENLIEVMLQDNTARKQVFSQLTENDFTPDWIEVVKYLNQTDKKYDELIDELEQQKNDILKKKITDLTISYADKKLTPIEESIAVIKERLKEDKKNELREALLQAEQLGDEASANDLMRQLNTL